MDQQDHLIPAYTMSVIHSVYLEKCLNIPQRPPPPVGPPPPNAARPYDRYVPGPMANYRDEYPGPYRAPGYPPEYPSNNLYPRSPSPDRYAAAGAEHWGDGRQNYWAAARSGWPERKPIVPQSPPGLVRGRDVATLATPMFEPSENWKQKQGPHRPPPQQPMHEPYRPYYPEANPYRRDVFPAGPSRHYEPVPNPARSRSPERRHNASPMRPKQHELSRKSSKSRPCARSWRGNQRPWR
ncbi:hypothetical protein FA13DRAFT_71555 [Coprinellus micaceus]|uniref:Uncharacterized protein n=1 Tax=Coprinellus micaceus TaxID=71717 RepID=A0A4Y7TJ15_COPMI|nr:hypothetical protein FA13DRAFT_71555 [Coprinellus micaceus]